MFRFFVGGIFVVTVDFGVYFFLKLILPLDVSKGFSFICAGAVGYVLNKYWTFKFAQASYIEMGRYAFINLMSLVVNVVINRQILNAWPGAILVALSAATAVTSIFTFVCFKWWVFRKAEA